MTTDPKIILFNTVDNTHTIDYLVKVLDGSTKILFFFLVFPENHFACSFCGFVMVDEANAWNISQGALMLLIV